jgi:hypothetical protein
MPGQFPVLDNHLADMRLIHVRLAGFIALAPPAPPQVQPSSSSHAYRDCFSQTHPTPKQIGQFLSITVLSNRTIPSSRIS